MRTGRAEGAVASAPLFLRRDGGFLPGAGLGGILHRTGCSSADGTGSMIAGIYFVLWMIFVLPIAWVHLVLVRHALRAGKKGWVVAIMAAPFLGGAVYYMEEYRPALRARRLAEGGQPEPEYLPFR